MMATGHRAMMVKMPTKGLIHMAELVILSWKGQSVFPGNDQRCEIEKNVKLRHVCRARSYQFAITSLLLKRKSTLMNVHDSCVINLSRLFDAFVTLCVTI